MFTDIGLNITKEWFAGEGPSVPDYVGVGSVGTAETVFDSGLGYEIARRTIDTKIHGDDRLVEYEMILPSDVPGTTVTLREVGVFDGSPTGSLFMRSTYADLEKTGDIEVQYIIGMVFE